MDAFQVVSYPDEDAPIPELQSEDSILERAQDNNDGGDPREDDVSAQPSDDGNDDGPRWV